MKSSVSKEQYQLHLLRAKRADSWFFFCRLYFKIMKRLEALFLQDLINLASMNKTKVEWIKGEDGEKRLFFLCTANYLKDSDSGWSIREQDRHLVSLKSKGYIQTLRRGNDGRRWIHIDLVAIESDLDLAEDTTKRVEPDTTKRVYKERHTKEGRNAIASRPAVGGNGKASSNGFHKNLPPKMKVPPKRPSGIHLDMAREFHRQAEKDCRKRLKFKRFAWANIFAYQERNMDDGPQRTRAFLNEWMAGRTKFKFNHPDQFFNALPIWERMREQGKWYKIANDGSVSWSQKQEPSAKEKEEYTWKYIVNGS